MNKLHSVGFVTSLWLGVTLWIANEMSNFVTCSIRLYLGCFGWVINLIYSTLFSNILHVFRHNITYAQNLGLSNCYALFTCIDLTVLLFCHVRMHSCHGASVIARKPAEPTAETAVDEVSNLSVM